MNFLKSKLFVFIVSILLVVAGACALICVEHEYFWKGVVIVLAFCIVWAIWIGLAFRKPKPKGQEDCKEEDCRGEIDFDHPTHIRLSSSASFEVYPCKKCGRLHKRDGTGATNDKGEALFLRQGRVTRRVWTAYPI